MGDQCPPSLAEQFYSVRARESGIRRPVRGKDLQPAGGTLVVHVPSGFIHYILPDNVPYHRWNNVLARSRRDLRLYNVPIPSHMVFYFLTMQQWHGTRLGEFAMWLLEAPGLDRIPLTYTITRNSHCPSSLHVIANIFRARSENMCVLL